MKKVLLLYPTMLFYKIPIFNKLEKYLREEGYELIIWATSYEDTNQEIEFRHIDDLAYNFLTYKKIIKEQKIDIVLNILFKSKPGLLFYLKVLFYTKIKSIPIAFYGHGVNLQKDSLFSNIFSNLFYFVYDGIILYTPNEISKIWSIFHYKITVANNTLDLDGRKELITEEKAYLKNKYKIKQDRIILTTGRLQSRKKLEILYDTFNKHFDRDDKVAWVIIGPDIGDELKKAILTHENIYYMGPVYNKKSMAEFFFMSDIYSIPGWMGLGIIEAMYWGLPVVTIKGKHAPEIYYVKNDETGYLAENISSYEENLKFLISNSQTLMKFSKKSEKIYLQEATLKQMFQGFLAQLNRYKKESKL